MKAARIGAIVIGALALVALGLFVAFNIALQQGKSALFEDDVSRGEGKVITYDGARYRLNDDVVSICVIGTDFANEDIATLNNQADAIMVLAVDTSTGKATCISIPRNTMVDINMQRDGVFQGTENMQICLAYALGLDDAESADLLRTAISRLFYNQYINHWFALGINCIDEMTDVLGGVQVEALEDIPGTDIKQGDNVVLRGMDGEHVSDPNDVDKLWVFGTAAWYVRYRDLHSADSPIKRQERLQQFAHAFAHKVLDEAVRNPATLMALYEAVERNAATDLDMLEMAYLASVLAGGASNISFVTLEGEMVYNDESPWGQFIVDKDALMKTLVDVYYVPA